jgi:hypothetical protein
LVTGHEKEGAGAADAGTEFAIDRISMIGDTGTYLGGTPPCRGERGMLSGSTAGHVVIHPRASWLECLPIVMAGLALPPVTVPP